jgi:hypothetical protein
MKPLDLDQAIVISAYTGVLICPFSAMHKEIEKRLGYPVFTHQLGDKIFIESQVRPAFKDDFLSLMPTTPDTP